MNDLYLGMYYFLIDPKTAVRFKTKEKNMVLPFNIECIEDHSNTADGGSAALSVDWLRSKSARRVEIKAKTVSS